MGLHGCQRNRTGNRGDYLGVKWEWLISGGAWIGEERAQKHERPARGAPGVWGVLGEGGVSTFIAGESGAYGGQTLLSPALLSVYALLRLNRM
jgi:hypothetical protein